MTLINRSAADKRVAVSPDDISSGSLIEKLLAGAGITFNVITAPGGEQTLELIAHESEWLHSASYKIVNGCKVLVSYTPIASGNAGYLRKQVC